MSQDSLARVPSPTRIKAEHHIALVDRAVPSRQTSYTNGSVNAERGDSDDPPPPIPGEAGLYKRLTNNSTSVRQSVRQEYNKQKYAKYGQGRYHVDDGAATTEGRTPDASMPGQEASPPQRGYLERAQSKAKGLIARKKTLGKGDLNDTIIDVLYENQRGMFFFGIPKYSSNSLLPADPKPWQNAQFRTSAVDIRNAQVPDPSWEWAWKSWYVDMSRDVDEEGWEYSFAFVGKGATTFAWHGNHPWFHSFVRRRRWLRMRKRKDTTHRTAERSHELTADYFTIHPKTLRPKSLMLGQNGSSILVPVLTKVQDQALDIEKMEITTIGDLFLAMKRSSVDREKILAVRKFTDEGGDELYYLSERMGEIMGMLIFQSSRRQLLGDLTSRHEQIHREQKDLTAHNHEDDETKQQAHERASRHADNLLKAVHAADEQVKRLEYWSDIKDISDKPDASNEKDGHHQPSFKNKQSASEGAPKLQKKPESSTGGVQNGDETTYETAREDSLKPSSKKSSVFYDSESKTSKKSKGRASTFGDDLELERYTTAPETPEEAEGKRQKGKGRAMSSGLDGVEEEPEADGHEYHVSPSKSTRSVGRSVQILEPVPDSADSDEHYDDEKHHFGDDSDVERSNGADIDRNETKTPDSVRQFMTQMRKPKNWIDQAFG
ncbi:hypothetical protein TI39_contig4199g00018 [Zymoseptoria brevis]|uniref:Peroxin/Ferlin domain-containing protein n=1 Tax=Zymoseptoria brevis TaxID=1047168 RepID=A0A0F4GAL6_9PEZI|nr:hypothetical protein TI39_contig4199g00018 [Zymoseptoria brevis]